MDRNWFKRRIKYFAVLALVAILALLLCFNGTRQVIFGLFGYAVFAYLAAITVACVFWISGRSIEIKKSRVLLYLGLFFAFLATLHVGLTKGMAGNFSDYIAGTFETATPGGILIAIVTSVLAVPVGYLPALLIFFALTAALGLIALLPLLVMQEKEKKRAKIVKREEPKRLPEPERPLRIEPLDDPGDALFSESEPFYTDVEPEPKATEVDRAFGALFGEDFPKREERKKEDIFKETPLLKQEEETVEPITERGSVIPGGMSDLKTTYYTKNSFEEIKRQKSGGAFGILQTDPQEYYMMKYGEEKKPKKEEAVFTEPTRPVREEEYAARTETQSASRYSDEAIEKRAETPLAETPYLDAEFEEKPRLNRETEPKEASESPRMRTESKGAVGFEKPRYVAQPGSDKKTEKNDDTNAAPVYRPRPYKAPPIELLDPDTEIADGEIEDYSTRKEIIESTIREFGIEGTVVNAIKGPAVTRYELRLAPGMNVKKVNGVKDNLMMNLSVNNITILTPIPGKPLVGIELPNFRRSKVSFRSMMNSPEFNKKEGKSVFAIGKTVDNRPYAFDLVDAPHMMVAGTTGSGKSVCINVFLMSLIYRYSPEDIRMILIDPKRVEMKFYSRIPHLLIPEPIVEVPEAINVLKWACGEMDRRYEFLGRHDTKDIDNYNRYVRKDSEPKMYRIIIVIDEMADLMMRAKGQAEESIVRIAQLGRAAGIHLVLATQRPVATIITGLIKANVPTCICCTTKTNLESRIVMDDGGAENLLGRGDLYFVTAKESDKVRMQAAFVDEPEIKRVCDYVRQNNEAYFDEQIATAVKVREPIDTDDAQEKLSQQDEIEKRDNALLRKIMITFIASQKASVSLAQKKHAIGYMKASRLVDQLEELGFITPEDGKNPRKVLISLEELDRVLPLDDGDEKDF